MKRYDIKGEIVEKDDKSVILLERTNDVCYIRIGSHNRLFQPHIDSVNELTVINARTGQAAFTMYKCSIQCFENYLEFLKTGSITFLHTAEREI